MTHGQWLASVTYKKLLQLSSDNSRLTQYEIEKRLGLKHGTQGKTIRRWKEVDLKKGRIPSQEMRSKIDVLYEGALGAHLYVDATHMEELPEYRADWKRLKNVWKDETTKKLVDIIRRNYRAKPRESHPVEFRIYINSDKPKRVMFGRWQFLATDSCTLRPILMYLAFTITEMSQQQWRDNVVAKTLGALQIYKPRLFRELRSVVNSL